MNTVSKHARHRQKSHGNWVKGPSVDDFPGNGVIPRNKRRTPKTHQKKDVKLKSGVVERETVATTQGRMKRGTLKDATHDPIKSLSRNQLASGKKHIKDNVPKKYEQYAGLIHRLAARGRVQSPEMRKEAAEKYGYDGDELYRIEKDLYAAMGHSPAEKQVEHHTIQDAAPKAAAAMREMGAARATFSPSSDDWLFQDNAGNWHLVDDDGSVSDIDKNEAEQEASLRAVEWGDIVRENLSDDDKRRITQFKARRSKANQNEADERAFVKGWREWLAEKMEAEGLDPTDENQRRIFLGQIGVLGDSAVGQGTSTPGKKKKVELGAADADKRKYRGHKPEPGRRAPDEPTTPAPSPRRIKKGAPVPTLLEYISKHGDPDTTAPAIYAVMHPRGRKTKWIRSLAQLDRDVSSGKKLVSGKDGKPVSRDRAAKLIQQGGGKHVYAVVSETKGDAKVTPRRVGAKVATPTKAPVTRSREKRTGGPVGFVSMDSMTAAQKAKEREKFKKTGIPIPAGWSDIWINKEGIQPGRGSKPSAGFGLAYIGKDKAGRAQYKYTLEYRKSADGARAERVTGLLADMDKLDKALTADMKKGGNNDIAGVVLAMREAGLRVGNTRDLRAKEKAYAATTLEVRHVKVSGNDVTFDFMGKKAVRNNFTIKNNKKLADMFRRQTAGKSPDEQVFPTADENKSIDYIKKHLGSDATNHDLRRSYATSLASAYIVKVNGAAGGGAPKNMAEFKKRRNEVGAHVASFLGNDRTEALGAYIVDTVFHEWLEKIKKGDS